MTDEHTDTEDDQAEDDALRVSDPIRWQLARMDRGAAARRFVGDLERRYPSTTPTDPAA